VPLQEPIPTTPQTAVEGARSFQNLSCRHYQMTSLLALRVCLSVICEGPFRCFWDMNPQVVRSYAA
jgi:hypothetical protein